MSSRRIILAAVGGGVLLFIIIVYLVWHNSGSIMQAAMDTPEGKKSFITSFKKSCGDSAKAAAGGQLTDAQIGSYCDCSATKIADGVKGDDLVQLMTTSDLNKLSPALQQQVGGIIAQCQSVIKR